MSKPVLSLEAFADWCEKQGDREYNYCDPDNCAISQYFHFLGHPKATIALNYVSLEGGCAISSHFSRQFPDGMRAAALTRPWNFSALAARLRSAS